MRVLFVTDRYPPDPVLGYERFVVCLASGLTARGHAVSVLAPASSGKAGKGQTDDGVEVYRYAAAKAPERLWMFGRTIRKRSVRPQLAELAPQHDVVIGPPPYVQYASRCAPRVPRVYAAGGTLLGARRWEGALDEPASVKMRLAELVAWRQLLAAERTAIRRADRIAVPSGAVRDQLGYYYGVTAEQVAVIPHGVDPKRFAPVRREADGVLRIVSVGRLDPIKNHRLLLEALAKAERREAMRLRLVGAGVLGEELRRRAGELGVEGLVEMVGHAADVERHYQWADVFVLPSLYEAFGIVILEAMSSGLPCVGLRCDPPHVWTASEELIADGVTGLLVERDDASQMAAALDRLADDPETVRRMGDAARARVETSFTWERTAERFEKLFESLGCGAAKGNA